MSLQTRLLLGFVGAGAFTAGRGGVTSPIASVRSTEPLRSSAILTGRCRTNLLRVRIAATSADGGHRTQDIPGQSAFSHDDKKKLSVPGVIFLVITYIWSVILFIPMAIAHPFVMWRDRATRRFHDFIAMAWMKCSFSSVLVRPLLVNAENIPAKGIPAVYVANHCSYLDIYAFAYLQRRIKYVSKAEIFRIPIVGWAMEMAGNIALLRMNRRGQMEAFRKMVNVIKNGLSLVIFPEGTRSATGKLRRFQSGAFRAAKQEGTPVVPVTILGTREVMPSHAWVPLRYPKAPISLVIHPPISSEEHSAQQLQDMAFDSIDSALPAELQTNVHSKRQ